MRTCQTEMIQRCFQKRYFISGLLLLVLVQAGPASAEIHTKRDKETGLRTWKWTYMGISIQFVQRTPDQTRAFFQARGFTTADADTIGRSCVFQVVFRNDGQQPLNYDLSDWKVTFQDKPVAIQTREHWERLWLEKDINQAARIAFNWSFLPTRQGFEPGDYNWGMASFGLSPGSTFDLSLALNVADKPVQTNLSSIVCMEDQP